jgi:hypothetical protein
MIHTGTCDAPDRQWVIFFYNALASFLPTPLSMRRQKTEESERSLSSLPCRLYYAVVLFNGVSRTLLGFSCTGTFERMEFSTQHI